MKNIFIAGVARSGKSTLANYFKKKGEYNYIPLDYFVSSLKRNFPELGIKSSVVIDKNSSNKLGIFLSRVIDIMNFSEEKYIIDSAHILPRDIIKYLNKDKWDIYYLGYPNIDPREKFNIIRKYDTEKDWSYSRTDEELLDICKKLVLMSKEIEEECNNLDIKFIDTSYGLNIEKN